MVYERVTFAITDMIHSLKKYVEGCKKRGGLRYVYRILWPDYLASCIHRMPLTLLQVAEWMG